MSVSASQKPEWTPRMWEGCDFFAWTRLLARNRFAVSWKYLYIAVIVTIVSMFHTFLRWLQEFLYGDQIRRTAIPHEPLFIVGHWRTGTTLLHELLILDDRHAFPTYYECHEPNHFLLTEQLVTRWLTFLISSHRPMDNMAAGWDRPQEDEFALCMMGQPSPYLTIAFPNHPPQCQEAFDLEGLSPQQLHAWKRAFLKFIRSLTFKNPGKRLVLKSPTHSCRIKTLLQLFPDARFVHIVRDPYVVFPSTVNLWKSLYQTHGLQTPRLNGLNEHVFDTFNHLYERLEEGKELIPSGRFHEVRYEDLVSDPVGQMRLLYERLHLGAFDSVLPKLQDYLAKTKNYRTNKYEHSPELRAEISRRWGPVIERYRYEAP
jgi:omega-hydroxy-beta-dihydromenaquinone-9 sulfotransferase